jgi:hypothetical protein
MRHLSSFVFHVDETPKFLELHEGDLTEMNPGDGVDLLIVSAFPGDYSATATSLIGALHRCGISVASLAQDKALDLRGYYDAWLSAEIPNAEGFKRILCYEPVNADANGLQTLFENIGPFIGFGNGGISVAMPVVGTGDRGRPAEAAFRDLLGAAFEALKNVGLEKVRIIERDRSKAELLVPLLEEFKEQAVDRIPQPSTEKREFDVFISYSQKDAGAAEALEHSLDSASSGIRIFRDKRAIVPGDDLRVKIDWAIRSSAKVVPLYSPEYVRSAWCKQEFNIAWSLRTRNDNLLFPIWLSAKDADKELGPQLDGDWRKNQILYFDAREADRRLLEEASRMIIATLPQSRSPGSAQD